MPGSPPDLFDVFRAQAQDAFKKGDFEGAEKLWLAALELAEGEGEESPRLTASLESLAEAFWYQHKFALAAPLLRRLLRIYQTRFGARHFDVGIVNNNMAMLYHTWGKHEEAEPFYKRALEIKERILGETHPETIAILGNYRDLLIALKRNDEASKLDQYAQSLMVSGWRTAGSARNSVPDLNSFKGANRRSDGADQRVAEFRAAGEDGADQMGTVES